MIGVLKQARGRAGDGWEGADEGAGTGAGDGAGGGGERSALTGGERSAIKGGGANGVSASPGVSISLGGEPFASGVTSLPPGTLLRGRKSVLMTCSRDSVKQVKIVLDKA